MADQQAPLKTYRGNCHCAAFVYEITLPEIKKVTECNCSVCLKKGAIFVWPKEIKYVKGDPSTLTDYTFNKGAFTHKFCSTCGVSLMIVGYLTKPKDGEDKAPDAGFNVRTFQHGQLDLWTIESGLFDGKDLPPVYKTPKYKGPEPEPTTEVEDGKLYTGSCHCGAVTLAVKVKTLNKDYKPVTDCNCSICGRYGALWTYPHKSQVVVEGKANMGGYLFNKKVSKKSFCKTCGVVVIQEVAQIPDEVVAKMDERFKKWYEDSKHLTPVNLRVLNDFDVKELKADQFDGYNFIQPRYVEP